MDTIMKRRRHTPEQAVRKIREGERLLSEGQDLAEVLRHFEVTEATFNRWRARPGRTGTSRSPVAASTARTARSWRSAHYAITQHCWCCQRSLIWSWRALSASWFVTACSASRVDATPFPTRVPVNASSCCSARRRIEAYSLGDGRRLARHRGGAPTKIIPDPFRALGAVGGGAREVHVRPLALRGGSQWVS